MLRQDFMLHKYKSYILIKNIILFKAQRNLTSFDNYKNGGYGEMLMPKSIICIFNKSSEMIEMITLMKTEISHKEIDIGTEWALQVVLFHNISYTGTTPYRTMGDFSSLY